MDLIVYLTPLGCAVSPLLGGNRIKNATPPYSPLKGGMSEGQGGLIAMNVRRIMNLPGIELFFMNNPGKTTFLTNSINSKIILNLSHQHHLHRLLIFSRPDRIEINTGRETGSIP